ncbi:oxygenase MpaB family protein [Arthrobacter sp. GMC3]|uniref:oxygenase MpaB family protein n=1 Tax=Arthrobacter sp. GMC3 TaxID=2058894 RepID=UPI000CE45E8A|nr:oxygenase MpaB family protein [Arthrobacter sp. GMC3]
MSESLGGGPVSRRTPIKGISDIAPEAVMLAGAGRAILLQLANPGVGYGVAQHSNFAQEPLKRLHGTLSYIYALTNGTPEQQKLVRIRVQRAHRPVKGQQSEAHPDYSASDPRLQLWVAATLYDSGMQSYCALFPELETEVADTVYRDYSVLGTALGMPAGLWPATRADFDEYWDSQLGQLRVDDTIKAVARELLAAKHAPLWVKAVMPLARFLTVGLLPAEVREMYGFKWSAQQEKKLTATFKLAAVLVRIAPVFIRHAPMHFYLKRLR